MTLPENQLPDRAHESGCSKPRSTSWYTRGRNSKGERTWVLGILSCPECGVSVMQPYRVNLTKKQKEKLIGIPKLPKLISENNYEIPTDENQFILFYKKWRLIQVIGLRKNQNPRRMKELSKERSRLWNPEGYYISIIKRLAKIYKKDQEIFPDLRGKINWDIKLVEEFLNIIPRHWELQEIINWPPLYRWNTRRTNSQRGRTWNSEMSDCWIGGNDPTEWKKLVIAEAQGRMQLMRWIIEFSKEPKIEVQALERKYLLK
jgi:hypothetical protein